MRICFLSTYPPDQCGIATYTSYLAEALCQMTSDLEIFILAPGIGPIKHADRTTTKRVFSIDDNYETAILENLRQCRPDIVHIQHEYGLFGLDERFICLLESLNRLNMKPFVTLHTVHTELSIDFSNELPNPRITLTEAEIEDYQKRIGYRAKKLIVHQKPIKQILHRQGIPDDRITVIPHGTRIERNPDNSAIRNVWDIPASASFLVHFGYLEPSKGTDIMIEALAQIKCSIPDCILWTGGYVRNGSPEAQAYRERCISLIDSLGLRESVVFPDSHVAENQVTSLLSTADVVCFPYDEDTRSSSGAMHRAIGTGAIVVANRIAKFDELRDVSDEILVQRGCSEHLAMLVKRIILDSDFRKYLRERTQAFANETSWQRVARSHLNHYEHTLSERAATALSH